MDTSRRDGFQGFEEEALDVRFGNALREVEEFDAHHVSVRVVIEDDAIRNPVSTQEKSGVSSSFLGRKR